jgi:ectoine hydroxylase-related dioxygenase (phytanoyl-CoA dioxygenase family)
VEPLLGPDIALFSSHFICKPPGSGQRVPWHEDSAYWKGQLEPMEVVTLWLAIDPSRRENGCLRVVPGSHHGGFSDYGAVSDPEGATFATEIRDPRRFEERAVAIELEANQASLHDGRLIHGSEANRSARRRCGYTMRYVSTRTRFDRERFPWHQIYLARGRDRAGNVYADPSRAHSELMAERTRVFRGH